MTPRKFKYEETSFGGLNYLVEWTEHGLEVQATTDCIPFLMVSDVIVRPSDEKWQNFEESVRSLCLLPSEPDEGMCDGSQVECHITFRNKLLKFDISNPSFDGFDDLKNLINQLTFCSEYPKGVFFDEEDYEDDV
jgi:hypothetical protein